MYLKDKSRVSPFYRKNGDQLYMKEALHNSEYIALTHQDEIQYYNHSGCLTETYKIITNTLVKDLNFLLYLNDEIFWEHLNEQCFKEQKDQKQNNRQDCYEIVRLRLCLESCLNVFARKAYMNYEIAVENRYIKDLESLPKENLNLWYQLKKIVLTVFYRISNAKNANQKSIVFDNWYLDNTKLLNICTIYGELNPEIVTKIVENTYLINPKGYYEDFKAMMDKFQWRLYFLSDYTKDLKIDLALYENINKKDQNYDHLYETLYESIFTVMFGIADILINLECVFKFFPKHCQRYVVESSILYKRFIVAYCKSREGVDTRAQKDTLANKLNAYVQLVRYKIASFFASSIRIIRQNVQQGIEKNIKMEEFYKMKMTFMNIGYYTLSAPALLYADRNNQELTKIYMDYSKEILYWLLSQNIKERKFAIKSIVNLFDKNHENFIHIRRMIDFERKFCKQLWPQFEQLTLMEKWKLPSFKQFRATYETQQRSRKNDEAIKADLKIRKLDKIEAHYNDDPDYENEKQIAWMQTQNEEDYDEACLLIEKCYQKFQEKTALKKLKLNIEPIPMKYDPFYSHQQSLFPFDEGDSGMTISEQSQSSLSLQE